MTLPTLKSIYYDVVLPSDKKTKIKIRPLTVGDEKILLMANESKKIEEIVNATVQVLKNCIVSECNVDELAYIDVMWSLIQLRKYSSSDIVPIDVKDKYGETLEIQIDLNNVCFTTSKLSNKIDLDAEWKAELQYPRFADFINMRNLDDDNDVYYNILKNTIISIFNNVTVYKFDKATNEEQVEFLDSIGSVGKKNLNDYFNDMPKLYVDAEFINSKEEKETKRLENIEHFFI